MQKIVVDIEKRAIKYYPTIRLEIIKDLDDNKIKYRGSKKPAGYFVL